MTTPPSLLAHLTGLAEQALPPADAAVMAAIATLPREQQDTVLAGMKLSRPVEDAASPKPIEVSVSVTADASQAKAEMAELGAAADEAGAKVEKAAKRGRPPKSASTFAAELLIACASGGLSSDEFDLYVVRAKEAGLL